MRTDREQFGKGVMLLLCVVLIMVSGCAAMGPPGATGRAAVIGGPVESSNGPLLMESRGDTCVIKCTDETGLGLNMGPDIAAELAAMGIREVSNEEDARYVIDVVSKDFLFGRGDGPATGKLVGAATGVGLGVGLASSGVLDPASAAAVGLGALFIGALVDEGSTPYFVALSADVVVDELVPPEPTKVVSRKGKKVKVGKEIQEPRAVQHKTVFTGSAKYMGHQATQSDAITVVRANLAKAIAGSFR